MQGWPNMLLKNAQVFFKGTFQRQNLLIKNGKIQFVPNDFAYDNAMDLTGHYIIPGLVDIHTHGCLGLDCPSRRRRYCPHCLWAECCG